MAKVKFQLLEMWRGVSAEAKIDLAWEEAVFIYLIFFYVLKQVPSYLSRLAECCNTVLLQSSRNVPKYT